MRDTIDQMGGLTPGAIIETDRLALRPLTLDDAGWIAETSSRWDVAQNLAVVPVPNPALGVELFILSVRVRESRYGGAVRAVTLRETGEPIGLIAAPSKGDGSYGLGYWFAPTAWGQGYATEAGQAMIDAVRANGAQSVHAGCFEGNDASQRVLEKLGFDRTGHISAQFSMAHMKNRPHVDMELRV